MTSDRRSVRWYGCNRLTIGVYVSTSTLSRGSTHAGFHTHLSGGAARLARVGRVVFGAWNDDYGAAGSVWDVLREGRLPVRVEVVGGVLERDCAQLVKSFFQDRRGGAGITEGV